MKYQIIASDLDKTLLGDDLEVSQENWEAIETLARMGVHFAPATGRAFREIPRQLREHPAIRYYITSNGAMTYDKATGKAYALGFTQELAREVLDRFYSYPVCVLLHADQGSYAERATHHAAHYESYHMNQIWVDFVLEKQTVIENFKEYAYGLPTVESFCVFFQNMEDLLECKKLLEQDRRLLVAQTDPYNLEVFTARAGKGNALRQLAKLLGVPEEATIGVGDSDNDRTMIEAAGLGLAMENAVPELKAAADAVICSNREHGVRYILEHYIR